MLFVVGRPDGAFFERQEMDQRPDRCLFLFAHPLIVDQIEQPVVMDGRARAMTELECRDSFVCRTSKLRSESSAQTFRPAPKFRRDRRGFRSIIATLPEPHRRYTVVEFGALARTAMQYRETEDDARDRATYYRHCASDARKQAQHLGSAEATLALVRIAELWDRLAASAESHPKTPEL